jgi:hypothetical protein
MRRLRALAIVLAAVLAAGLGDCRWARSPGDEAGGEVSRRPIEEVLKDHTPELMALPGVTGTYQGALDDGRPCITVMVVSSTPELEARIPRELEGYPVRIEETGEIRAMPGEGR